jgi:CheY-like chemotaxis protein
MHVPAVESIHVRASPDASDPLRCQTGVVEPSAAILIVDDHDGFRAFARAMLEAAGFTVAEAATGAEATEAAGRVRPRLVLLDIQLPDFDGFEVARRLTARPGGPVIVLTSTREASDYGGRITSSPAAAFLPKDQLSGAVLRRFLPQDPR